MYRQHEHRSLGQEQSSSPTTSAERCIPIKRRWLQKFDPSKGSTSSVSSDSNALSMSDTDLPQHCLYRNEQAEALDLSKGRKANGGSFPRSQVSPNKSKASIAANCNRTPCKRVRHTQTLLGERNLKRLKNSSTAFQVNQLTGTSYHLPSAVHARDSFGKLVHEPDHSNSRRYREQDYSQRDCKWESVDRQEKAREQQQSGKTILEQCLRGLGPLPARPTLQNVLRYQDHTKLSIGERTELDKMHDKELLAKYLEATCEKHAVELHHFASTARRVSKDRVSTMLFDLELHWDGLDSQGSSKSSRADSFSHSYGTTLTRQNQPYMYESQSEINHNSTLPQDLVRKGDNLSTISINDLFTPVVASQSLISVHQISSLATDQSDNLQQVRKGTCSTTNEEISSTNVKLNQPKVEQQGVKLNQPKVEQQGDLPSCQIPKTHYNLSAGVASSGEVEHHVTERVESKNPVVVVKSEADTCSLPENEHSLTPSSTCTTRRHPDSKAAAEKPLDGKCPICTDVISGYHYGTHSCESCKGFFKRTIQNKRNERLACALVGNCVIDLQNRKHCASCRFKKCLDVGMKQEAVREDRQRGGRSIYEGSTEQRRRQHLQLQRQEREALGQTKKRKPRKRAPSTTTQPPAEDGDDQSLEIERMLPPQTPGRNKNVPSDLMALSTSPTTSTAISKPSTSTRSTSGDSCDEVNVYLKRLENLEATFFNPFGLPRISIDRTNSEKSLLTGAYYLLDHFCKKLPSWIEVLPFLQDLEVFDRSVLLKANWLQVLLLTVCFRCHDNKGHLILPDRSSCDMMAIVSSVAFLDIVRRMKQLAQKFQALKTTQDEYFYLKLLILLNPDVKNLSQPSRIRSYQEKVQEYLFDLGMAREGISASMKTGELLLKLSELERLSHLIKEHLVFTQVAGQLGPRNYSNLENMLEDY